mgnify:CR=1 FL=1
MKKIGKRLISLIMAGMLAMPLPAFAADGAGTTAGGSNSVTVNIDRSRGVEVEQKGDGGGGSLQYEIRPDANYQLEEIEVEVTPGRGGVLPPQTLTEENTNIIFSDVQLRIDSWPTDKEKGTLTIDTVNGTLSDSYNVEIGFQVEEKPTYQAAITATSNHAVLTAGGKDEYYAGEAVTLSVDPEDGYHLTGLKLTSSSESQNFTGSGTWKEWTVSWSAEGETRITGNIAGDIEVEATIEEIPTTYQLTIDVEDGLELERPSSRVTSVLEGSSQQVRVSARSGYVLSDFTVQYGNSYASWATGQDFLTMGNTRVEVNERDDEVSFILPYIYEDTNIYFSADYDEDNIPVEIDEGSRINIDTDVGDTVARGEDAVFYISTTSDRYSVRRITLRIGDRSGSADPDDEEIRVGNRTYEIEDIGDGEYALYVDNISEPVTVSASSNSSSVVSRPTLTIRSSSRVKITKSVSSSRIDAGDDVQFYFTPDTNYQVDEITVRIGDNSRTVGADNSSIRVGGETYQMSRNAAGVVTLYLTDIEENVTVSASAYYSRDPIQPTNTVRIDLNSRAAFMNGYGDGTFHPESNMTRAEAVVTLYRLCDVNTSYTSSNVFRDVPSGMWYTQPVNAFAEGGIIDRTTYFYPDQNITRADLVEMLYRLVGSPSVSGSNVRFNDVWGTSNSDAIQYAASRGWVNGYKDGSFRPYGYITRSEVAAVVTRVLGRTTGGTGVYYRDVPSSHWAYRYIQMASSYV